MRLRFFRVRKKPPLHDTQIVFRREDMLGLSGSIHFVVGVNGTGKSRMLQTLTSVLLTMEQGEVPDFPVTLAYDLSYPDTPNKARTICFHRPASSHAIAYLVEYTDVVPENAREKVDRALWAQLEDENGNFRPDRLGTEIRQGWRLGSYSDSALPPHLTEGFKDVLPDVGLYLPSILLAYTSGATGAWEHIFAPPPPVEVDQLPILLRETTRLQERPFGWRPPEVNTDAEGSEQSVSQPTIATWVRGEDYRFALLAVVLQLSALEFENELAIPEAEDDFVKRRERARRRRQPLPERYDESFRSILDEVGWLWPLTATFRTTAPTTDPDWQRMAQAATAATREPEPVDGSPRGRMLHYDLRVRVRPRKENPDQALDNDPFTPEENGPTVDNGASTARRLLRALNGIAPDLSAPNDVGQLAGLSALRQMLFWQRRGVLRSRDVRIVLRKTGAEAPIALESLSDGEKMFLGRMALLYLVQDSPNALVLLDEPETHFNDYWKREMIDILDGGLHISRSDIVLTTHSSIALTDAFDREITLLKRPSQNPDQVIATGALPPTFGASPAEVLQEIFHGPRAVGQRAAELLDTVLVIMSYPKEVEEYWQREQTTQLLPEVLRLAMYERFLKEEDNSIYDDSEENEEYVQREEADVYLTESERSHAQEQLDRRLYRTLIAFGAYGRSQGYSLGAMLPPIIDDLMEKVGAGYYLFEFERRRDALPDRQEV